MRIFLNIKKSFYIFLLFVVFSLAISISSQSVDAKLYNSKHKKEVETSVNDKKQGKSEVQNNAPDEVSAIALVHFNNVAANCKGKWEQASCLKELSQLSMDMVTIYADSLRNGGHKSSLEPLKVSVR